MGLTKYALCLVGQQLSTKPPAAMTCKHVKKLAVRNASTAQHTPPRHRGLLGLVSHCHLERCWGQTFVDLLCARDVQVRVHQPVCFESSHSLRRRALFAASFETLGKQCSLFTCSLSLS